MLTIVLLLMCVGAGTVSGVFFAFSAFVMQALTQLPASQTISQRVGAYLERQGLLVRICSVFLLSVNWTSQWHRTMLILTQNKKRES